jgi:hypothetical protein
MAKRKGQEGDVNAKKRREMAEFEEKTKNLVLEVIDKGVFDLEQQVALLAMMQKDKPNCDERCGCRRMCDCRDICNCG